MLATIKLPSKTIYKPHEWRPYLHTEKEWKEHGFQRGGLTNFHPKDLVCQFWLKQNGKKVSLWQFDQLDLIETPQAFRQRMDFFRLYTTPEGRDALEKVAMQAVKKAYYKPHRNRFTVALEASEPVADYALKYGHKVYAVEYCYQLMDKLNLR